MIAGASVIGNSSAVILLHKQSHTGNRLASCNGVVKRIAAACCDAGAELEVLEI